MNPKRGPDRAERDVKEADEETKRKRRPSGKIDEFAKKAI